ILVEAIAKVHPHTSRSVPATPAHPAAAQAHESHNGTATAAADASIDPIPDPMLDHRVLDELLEMGGGDHEFLAEMIDSYLATAPDLLEKLRRSAAASDAATLRLAAHTLKSGSTD